LFEPDGEIDYSTFSRSQLEEALENIDKDQYPQNYQNLQKELSQRPPAAPEPPEVGEVAPVLSRKAITGTISSVGLGMLFVARFGPDTTISMNPVFGVVVPALAACLLLGFCWRLFKKDPTVRVFRVNWGIKSEDTRQAILVVAMLASAGFLGYFVRDCMRTLAATLDGERRSTSAMVEGTSVSDGAGIRCREFATFELQNGRAVQICVRHRYRPDLVTTDLDVLEHVTLILKSNLIGDSVVRIVRPQPSAQRPTE